MVLFEEVLLNIMLVSFPILIYFVYGCYTKILNKKYNIFVLGFALFSSLYLCLKYGTTSSNNIMLLFCNVPIVIAYTKKKEIIGVILSILSILYCYYIFDYEIILMLIKYILYFILYCLTKNKINSIEFVSVICVIQGFFLSFEYFFAHESSNIFMILNMLFTVLVIYSTTIFIMFLLQLGDKITTLYSNLKLLEKDKQIKESLFKITHEIKNPIAVCKGYLDMLDINNKEKVVRYVPIIREEIDRCLNIMTDFMQFSKIKLDKELVDINLLLDDVYDSFKILNKLKNIELNYVENDDEVYINGDYNRLKQVLINLLKNSAEAIENKGIISINSESDNKCFVITIKDNGKGMTKETLEKIKEIFYTTKEKGSGIGVSLSNEIIKAHGGKLEYFSSVGVGTEAKIVLPIINSI